MVSVLLGVILFSLDLVLQGDTYPSLASKDEATEEQYPWEQSGFFEGDIIVEVNSRNLASNPNFRWPDGEVPFEISSDYNATERETILEALAHIGNKSCIKFRLYQEHDAKRLIFLDDPNRGCSTQVGFRNRPHTIQLSRKRKCLRLGTIIHEVLHALGFSHQQSAKDRDDYVDIMWANIKPGHEKNFGITMIPSTNLGFNYDYSSIMHYSSYAFSKNGRKTIVPRDELITLVKTEQLSDTDIGKLNKMYNCT